MTMTFATFCSGIEAPAVAWKPLGWKQAWSSEIVPFPCAVLDYHYPDVPNVGDMEEVDAQKLVERYGPVDLVCAGTPCQSFSIAGLRKGLDDPRGNLTLVYLGLVERILPRWVVWENVPGVLSDDEGRTFGTFLGALVEFGYGLAYRVLDAQYVRVDGFGRAVPQRRERVFVIGCLGDWRSAAAVLFERESMSGNPAPRREKGEKPARCLSGRPNPSHTEDSDIYVAAGYGGNKTSGPVDVATACRSKGGSGHGDFESETFVAHSLRGEGFDASEDGTGRGTPLVYENHGQDSRIKECGDVGPTVHQKYGTGGNNTPLVAFNSREDTVSSPDRAGALGSSLPQSQAVAIQERAVSENPDAGPDGKGFNDEGCAYTLEARNKAQAVAYHSQGGNIVGCFKPSQGAASRSFGYSEDISITLEAADAGNNKPALHQGMTVRRLMPVECERLQGFPDNYTNIPWRRGKPSFEWELTPRGKRLRGPEKGDCPDGPRYKALGNAMAVNVMRWIGRRIEMMEAP